MDEEAARTIMHSHNVTLTHRSWLV